MKVENNNMILSEQTVSKEYQIPELVDLNSVSESNAGGAACTDGSSAFGCTVGGIPNP
jgi:hypothetical protein